MMKSAQGIACIVLAAGGSRRLGSPKQLVRHRGRSLLAHSLATAASALPGCAPIVVLGAEAQRLRLLVRRVAPRAHLVGNARWAEGLASSLEAGLGAAPRHARAALLLLVDQPRIDAAALRKLIGAWSRKRGVPAAAYYDGRAGVPAVIPRRNWRNLRGLTGDSGARTLLRSAPTITLVAMPEAAVDIDTPSDVTRLKDRR